jgi:hypothetical protein
VTDVPAPRPQSPIARTVTLVSAVILIAAQTITAAVAGGWAIAGFLGFGEYVAYAFEAVGLALGVWAVVAFVKAALRNDPSRSA